MHQNSIEGLKIKEVNEIYHDLEAECYVQRHPEIYIEERSAWEYIGKTFLKTDKPLTVLDIGTGTGFVPLSVAPFLKENDMLICTDISSGMLRMTEKKMMPFDKIKKMFIKADALEVCKMDIKADVVTMNSVLHHIPDYEDVLPRLNKLINKGGIFIITHERNKLFAANRSMLLSVYQEAFKANIFLRKSVKRVLTATGLYHKKSQWQDFNQKVHGIINGRKISDKELSIEDINAMVDVHDPDERGEGFDPFEIHRKFFPEFEVVSMVTYKHLGPWINENGNIVNRLIAGMVKKGSPDAGALFRLVMRK